MWQSQEHLLERVVENWLADPTFATILRDGAYVWCGAAAHRDSYFVLLVAG